VIDTFFGLIVKNGQTTFDGGRDQLAQERDSQIRKVYPNTRMKHSASPFMVGILAQGCHPGQGAFLGQRRCLSASPKSMNPSSYHD
jgi:hypothetical protein